MRALMKAAEAALLARALALRTAAWLEEETFVALV
jgi:hypothetical protein